MEHFRQSRPSTSRVIANGSLSPTNSPTSSPRTKSRHNGLRNHHDKGSAASWRNPNPPTGYGSPPPPPPQSRMMPGFGLVSTSSASPSSLPSLPTGLHQGANGLAYQNAGSSHHVFGSTKSIFGSLNVQYKMPSHRNVEHEEAMDIDSQEDMDMGSSVDPISSQSKALRSHASLTNLESTKKNDSHSTIRSWKQLTIKSKILNEPTKAEKTSSSEESSTKPSKGTATKKAIYIVMHVSRVTIGRLHAKASAPVKIYAEKVFLEVELDDHSTMSLKIPCKDFTHCTVSFELPKPLIAFTLSKVAIRSIVASNKEKENLMDLEQQGDDGKNRIVLQLNSTSLTREVKQDLTELFQKRLANQITWKEVSSSEMNSLLHPENTPAEQTQEKDAPCTESLDSETSKKPTEPSSSAAATIPPRKILTPKKSRVQKGVFPESSPSNSGSSSTDTSTAANTVTQSSAKTTCNATNDTQENKIVTRSRRRKADAAAKDFSSHTKTSANDTREPVGKPEGSTKCSTNDDTKNSGGVVEETTERDTKSVTVDNERDLLHHHSKIESQITLLGQHSEKQRHSLEHHQKLLTLEREERSRSFEKIQELQSTNRENQEFLRQQNETIDILNREVENQKMTVLQLQQELGQEREASIGMRKVQTDLILARRELEEEKVVRGIRDKQLLEKETELTEVRRVCAEERSLRQGLNEELQRVQNACVQHMDELENQRLFRQTQDRELQGREDRIQENERRYQDEHATRLSLEEELRRLRLENDELRRTRDAAQNDLREERQQICRERETFNQERQNYDQRLRDGDNAISDSERRIRELQAALSTSQGLIEESRRIEPRDWIIRREEVTTTDRVLGTGAWGTVKVGVFRGSKVAVKQIHELILSPHNRRLFEREMSIASRCRHPCLLQFIGATNDDGSPLFLTEILDTDLRAVLSRRSIHQEEIIAIALDVARSLNYLHLSKPFPIVHRDISSSNVLLWRRDTSWRAKLSDYGAANFMRQCMTVNPGAGIYAAPEASTSQQSTKVDIYSFGLLLCEMCIRELPVPQQTQEQVNLVTNGVLRELVMRCVHTDPEARPTMAEVITLLEQQEENLVQSGLVSVNGRTASI